MILLVSGISDYMVGLPAKMDSSMSTTFQKLSIKTAQVFVYDDDEPDYMQFVWPGSDVKVSRKVLGWFPKVEWNARWSNATVLAGFEGVYSGQSSLPISALVQPWADCDPKSVRVITITDSAQFASYARKRGDQ